MNNGKIYWNRVIAIVFGLTIIAISTVFLTVEIVKIYQIKKDIRAQEAFLVSAGSISNNMLDKEELLKIEKELDFVEKIMPVKQNNMDILNYLEMRAVESNVYIISIGFQEDQIKEEYTLHPVYVTIQGEYKEIIKYISELRNGMRPFKVSNIKIGRADESEKVLHCELLIYALYQSPMDQR